MTLYLRYLFIAIVAATAATAAIAQSRTATVSPDCDAPCFGDGSAIILDVKMKNRTFRFLLHTGSAYTVLDSTTFRPILPPFNGRGLENGNEVKDAEQLLTSGDLLVEGRLPIRAKSLYHASLARLSAASGESIHGLLGCDFLNEYVVAVNGDTGRVKISRKQERFEGKCIALDRDPDGRPIVHATARELSVNDSAPAFLLDSGSVGFRAIILRNEFFQPLLDRGQLRLVGRGRVAQLYTYVSEREGELNRLQLWNVLEKVGVRETSNERPNSIGLSYLMQFNFTFDFPRSKLYLQPRASAPNLLWLRDMSGLSVLREASEVIVKAVDPQSPAALAGIRDGDVIASVDGINAVEIRLMPMRTSFCQEGKTVRLGMRREAKMWSIDLELRDWRKPATAKDFE